MMQATQDAAVRTSEQETRQMYEEIGNAHLFPFWARSSDVEHDEIKQLMQGQRAVPYIWRYKEVLEPLLQQSARLISTADSDRRSLILTNPGLKPRRATVTTMYTAYRLNDPNEIMPPHRHTASAIRLGLTGSQNFTGVEGEDVVFGPGDMVLTPRDTWHNHGNVGNEPAINLSVLDYPLVETLNALSFDHDYSEGGAVMRKQSARFPADYSAITYGAGGLMPRFVDHRRGANGSSPMFIYRYEAVRELLEKHREWAENPYEGLRIEYVDPLRGGPVYKTMTFFMQMLRPGERTLPMKQTASLLVSPLEGEVRAVLDGEAFETKPFDTLAVPGGTWAEYENTSATQPAIVFIASDEPALRAFGLLQRWGKTAGGDVMLLD
ncbi:gentisate 1,2-dioxygenase [Pandoraea horticolens]|uniref:Gentisate 1,2-dioxygenase n=1 Tax=Pandoraea horticolens TaxID=2508298 RepID=A0A5E4VN91_9BURK|nr:cupin domain-containing protein [Pandoraea horticolens]VVE13383.1 gentisate 1,2-dioxygenase [Pandoraea horticolens]